jgi:superfamily II DNA/RNA helicase
MNRHVLCCISPSFCSETKRNCDNLTRQLRMDGYGSVIWLLFLLRHETIAFCSWPALAIHGDKGQQERDWVKKNVETATRLRRDITHNRCLGA